MWANLPYANLLSLVAGVALLVSSGSCAGRHILLQPRPEGWPITPPIMGHVLFAFAAGMLFAGMKLITVAFEPSAEYPPNATPLFALTAVLLGLYQLARFASEYRQWRTRTRALAQFRAKGYALGDHGPGGVGEI